MLASTIAPYFTPSARTDKPWLPSTPLRLSFDSAAGSILCVSMTTSLPPFHSPSLFPSLSFPPPPPSLNPKETPPPKRKEQPLETYRKHHHYLPLSLHHHRQVKPHLKPPKCFVDDDVVDERGGYEPRRRAAEVGAGRGGGLDPQGREGEE